MGGGDYSTLHVWLMLTLIRNVCDNFSKRSCFSFPGGAKIKISALKAVIGDHKKGPALKVYIYDYKIDPD